jgi:tricorn protease
MKKWVGCLVFVMTYTSTFTQINTGLYLYPDVSKTQIVFTYANDLWIIAKDGGKAVKLSSAPGVELFPKFSTDGKRIAFTGNYDGNDDVYVIPATGGVPIRVTSHGYRDRVVDWTNDNKKVLFASLRESGRSRFNQFYTIPATGGPTEKLPMPFAEYGSYSPDGKQMALVMRSQVRFTAQFRSSWKRYRGGNLADIHIFNLQTKASYCINSPEDAGCEFPMWHGNSIYFLSDRGPELRMNLWRYDLNTKQFEQLTKFTDYDIHYPSMGPDDIVYEAGGKLYLYNLAAHKQRAIPVNIVTEKAGLKSTIKQASKFIQYVSLSPDGRQALFQARGDVFSVPAENGSVMNLTRTSSNAERFPVWSPDGKSIAYWSDQSGEYELWIMQAGNPASAQKLTNYGPGFRYNVVWSPDSKKLSFIDKAGRIWVYDITTSKTTEVDKSIRWTHENLKRFTCSWSPDSRWLAYHRDMENVHNAIYIYDYANKKLHQVTNGYYDCSEPVFDAEGKYLYLLTVQPFQPEYNELDENILYFDVTQPAAIALKKTTPAALAPEHDQVATNPQAVDIDLDGLEERLEIFPLPPAKYRNLAVARGKLIYMKYTTLDLTGGTGSIHYFDLAKQEEKTIIDSAGYFTMAAGKQKMLVARNNAYAVLSVEERQSFSDTFPLGKMQLSIDLVQEWKQMFMDVWRFERDYFYDTSMHGVNWEVVKARYLKMLEGAASREDVDFIIGEMIGELNASHAYRWGGDMEQPPQQPVGYLGIDWQAEGNYYKIKKIGRAASWDAETRSSFDKPGMPVAAGDYILAVNGVPLTTATEPYKVFQGLANKSVEITYNTTPSFTGAKKVTLKTMADEYRLRNLAWIEKMRKQVDEATQGEVGYIYVPNTAADGKKELLRQFYAQWHKKALIIDERFNGGGNIPDRMIELLNRDPLCYWAIRDGKPWPWPPFAHFGPKVMLINGWSGSGGDCFPDYFRKKRLGPLIGTRTYGALIGIPGTPELVDGGTVTAPAFRMYDPDGTWSDEGSGVKPDIYVPEDLSALANGSDPQLERAIAEIKNLLKTKEYKQPPVPASDKHSF